MLRRKKVVLDINKKHFTYNQRFILLSMIPIYFMLIGLLIQTPSQILNMFLPNNENPNIIQQEVTVCPLKSILAK